MSPMFGYLRIAAYPIRHQPLHDVKGVREAARDSCQLQPSPEPPPVGSVGMVCTSK